MADAEPVRCRWVTGAARNMLAYHDDEWGVPLHDDRALFELLTLEGAQAGLSWTTVLNRRDGYRRAFGGFDIATVAGYGAEDEARLLADAGIIRNRAKVASAIGNARAALEVIGELGSLDRPPVVVRRRPPRPEPLAGPGGDPGRDRCLAGDVEGPQAPRLHVRRTDHLYAFMQSAGLVNDHQVQCFRYAEVARLA